MSKSHDTHNEAQQAIDFFRALELGKRAERQSIRVDKAYVWMCDGNWYYAAALAQIAYWFGYSTNGSRKGKRRAMHHRVDTEGDMRRWVVKTHEELADECEMKPRTMKRAVSYLREHGLIHTETHYSPFHKNDDGEPTRALFIRLDEGAVGTKLLEYYAPNLDDDFVDEHDDEHDDAAPERPHDSVVAQDDTNGGHTPQAAQNGGQSAASAFDAMLGTLDDGAQARARDWYDGLTDAVRAGWAEAFERAGELAVEPDWYLSAWREVMAQVESPEKAVKSPPALFVTMLKNWVKSGAPRTPYYNKRRAAREAEAERRRSIIEAFERQEAEAAEAAAAAKRHEELSRERNAELLADGHAQAYCEITGEPDAERLLGSAPPVVMLLTRLALDEFKLAVKRASSRAEWSTGRDVNGYSIDAARCIAREAGYAVDSSEFRSRYGTWATAVPDAEAV